MRDYINIGSCPWDSDCVQVGQDDYTERSRIELKAFIAQIRRVIGPEPDGARLAIKTFQHDFGSYSEVVCHFDTDLPKSEDYAFEVEGSPRLESWDTNARQSLEEQGILS